MEPSRESTLYQSLDVPYKKPATALAIDSTGAFAALGGKKGIYITDLEEPWDQPKLLHHGAKQTQWDTSVIQWNPHAEHATQIASAANTQVFLWNVDDKRSALQATMSPHSRPVADLCWALSDPHVLATCSADTYVILWDTRSPKTSLKLKAFCAWTTGAQMVKWNKRNPRLLASTHDGEVFIWDVRKESAPIAKITAHKQISSMDWSHHAESQLVTSSTDRTVKFWDFQQPSVCQAILQTGNPVSKVKYTPFGRAIMTISQRSDFAIRLWSLNDLEQPVYQFMGHKDVVSSIDWRVCDVGEDFEYQLISWSKDQNLRFWPIEIPLINSMQARDAYGTGARSIIPSASTSLTKEGFGSSLGIYPVMASSATVGTSLSSDVSTSHGGSHLLAGSSALSSSGIGPQSPRKGSFLTSAPSTPSPNYTTSSTITNLEQEFSILQRRPIQGVIIEEQSLQHRTLQIRLGRLPYLMRIKITFPSLYPNFAAPSFDFLPITEQDTKQLLGIVGHSPKTAQSLLSGPSKLSEEEKLALKVRAKQLLIKVAYAFVSINLVCVDPCCNQLLELLEQFHTDPKLVLQQDDPDKDLKIKPEEYYRSFSLSSGSVPSTPSRRENDDSVSTTSATSTGNHSSSSSSSSTLSTSLGKDRIMPRLTFSEASTSGSGLSSATLTNIAMSPPRVSKGGILDGPMPKTMSDMNLSRFLDSDYLLNQPSSASSTLNPDAVSGVSSRDVKLPVSQSTPSLTALAASTAQLGHLPTSISSTNLSDLASQATSVTTATSSSNNSANQASLSAVGSSSHSGDHTAVSSSSGTPSIAAPTAISKLPLDKNLEDASGPGGLPQLSASPSSHSSTRPLTARSPLEILAESAKPSKAAPKPPTLTSGTLQGSTNSVASEASSGPPTSAADLDTVQSGKVANSSSIASSGTVVEDIHLNQIPAPRTFGALFHYTGQLLFYGISPQQQQQQQSQSSVQQSQLSTTPQSGQQQSPVLQTTKPSRLATIAGMMGTLPSSTIANQVRTYEEFLAISSKSGRRLNARGTSHSSEIQYDNFLLDGEDAVELRGAANAPGNHRSSHSSDIHNPSDDEDDDESGMDSRHMRDGLPPNIPRAASMSVIDGMLDMDDGSLSHSADASSYLQHLHSQTQRGIGGRLGGSGGNTGVSGGNYPLHKVRSETSMKSEVFLSSQLRNGFRMEWFDNVTIYDLSGLIPISPTLAKLYTLSGLNASSICAANLAVARSVKRADLVKTWSIVEAQTHPSVYPGLPLNHHAASAFDATWAMHPLGHSLLRSMFKHYESIRDVQTLAILSCIIAGPSTPYGVNHPFPSAEKKGRQMAITGSQHYGSSSSSGHARSSSYTSYNIINGPSYGNVISGVGSSNPHGSLSSFSATSSANSSSSSLSTTSVNSSNLSNTSLLSTTSEALSRSTMAAGRSTLGPGSLGAGNYKSLAASHLGLARDRSIDSPQFPPSSHHGHHHHSHQQHHDAPDSGLLHYSLVEPERVAQYNRYRRAYAEMLYMLGEYTQRARILKYVADPQLPNDGVDFVIICEKCAKPLKSPYCQNCKVYGFNCDICHLRVIGMSTFCLKCGHGGHEDHLRQWFSKEVVCPAGCGCACMEADM